MEATAGSEEAGSGASNVLDELPNTIWHTEYDGTDRENMWIDLKLPGATTVNALRYCDPLRRDS